MKKFLLTLFVVLGSLTLVACKDDPTDPTDPTDPDNNGQLIDFADTFTQKSKIRVWIDDEEGEYMEAVIAEFNKVYPNIVVEHEHMGSVDARELLKTFGPSGNGADVFQFPHDHLAQAVLEDLVYPLPDATRTLLEERSAELGLQIATLTYDESANSFDPESANAVERLYAVPMSLESVGLYYNTDLITTPAATYEELFAAADVWNATLASDASGRTNAEAGLYYLGTSSHWADSYFVQQIYSAFGFYPFGATLDDPSAVGFVNAVPALNWMRDELKPRTTGTGSHNSISASGNFELGKIPYIIAGPWNIEAYKAAGVNFAIAPIPTINVGGTNQATSTFAGAQMAAVYKYSENREDAIKFVEFLASDIAMELMYQYKGKLPALKTELLSGIEGVSTDTYLLAMADQLTTSVPMPTIPQVTYYWGPGETMIIEVWNNGVAPATAAATAEQSYRTRVGLAG
ncbi:MAG: extracellular solute-binding protein [Acholeplasmataceae bacterium]|nr:extracellular solute-binding protein [Acholeplasmataceae bacterium]